MLVWNESEVVVLVMPRGGNTGVVVVPVVWVTVLGAAGTIG